MVRRVRVLDQETVNKIAAGEVVEAPPSVVKELLENSIDADAGDITVTIEGGGIKSIHVKDDGIGMSREDAEVAFTRHSTSKIASIGDLGSLSSLGFRGEALASIAAVSRVEMVTRERGSREGSGVRVVVSAGKMLTLEPAGCPEGTTITVMDLFENVPARKRFLKSPSTERSRCIDIALRTMMSHPEIGFRLVVDGSERVRSPASGSLRERAAAILGVKTAKGMRDIPEKRCGGITVRGIISLPWETRSSSAGVLVSINGRHIRNRSLVEAVRRAYGSRLMKGRFPVAVIYLEVSPERMDVNVHPTKDLVKFEREEDVLECLEKAATGALFGPDGLGMRASGHARPPTSRSGGEERMTSDSEGVDVKDKTRDLPRIARSPRQIGLMVPEPELEGGERRIWEHVPKIEGIRKLPPAMPEDASKLKLVVIGQLDRTYILCELGGDLLLVDQHAAHERIRLEMLHGKYNDGSRGTQELLEPLHLELSPSTQEKLDSMAGGLSELGFSFESFGGNDIIIRGLPQFLGRTEAHEVLRDLAEGRETHDGCSPPDESFVPPRLTLKDRVIALAACRGAIKAHKSLSLKEMEDLISDLLKCDVPLHCAHGRPTMIRLPLDALERWFKRVL